MGDWTSQNWTKRDGRNNQEEEEEQQEKKATYKTAAELAVKKSSESTDYDNMNISVTNLRLFQIRYGWKCTFCFYYYGRQ
jgi:hypothetical protein